MIAKFRSGTGRSRLGTCSKEANDKRDLGEKFVFV